MTEQDNSQDEVKPSPPTTQTRVGSVRQLTDALVCLALAVILFRAFEVEGYMISTGSMAPSLFGYHRRVVCPSCRFPFALGDPIDEQPVETSSEAETNAGRTQRTRRMTAVCPNCGQASIDVTAVPRNPGDQLLVHKHAYLFHRPRRWEVAVFRNPNKPAQAYVKRVVGLPGESVQVIGGEVYVNGTIRRKNLVSQRAARICVYDADYRPAADDPTWKNRWSPEPARTEWTMAANRFGFQGDGADADGDDTREVAWVRYRHWARSRQPGQPPELSPVRDVYGYNRPGETSAEHAVRDVMLALTLTISRGRGEFVLQMTDGERTFDFVIDTARNELRLHSGEGKSVLRRVTLTKENVAIGEPLLLEMSLIDRQVLVAVNGQLPFQPWPLPDPDRSSSPPTSPAGFGARGLAVAVSSVKLYRDVYYTRAKGINGIDEPYQLAGDEFFVLGDNSPVSLDSRSWQDGAVSVRLFIGKPFLVHLPSRPGKIRFGDRSAHFRIPDFSRIRYIR